MGTASSRNAIDMLNGPLPGKIILFAVPLALSSIIQQLFNTTDSIYAGHMIGSEALAAIGGTAPIVGIFVTLMTGLSIGANVVIAVHIGHGDLHRIKGAIQTIAVVSLACGVLFTACGTAATDPILAAVHMPLDAWEQATQYLHVYFAGFTFFLVYNFGSAILRAKGDTRRPLYALAVGAVLNVALDYVAVLLGAGVAGIAGATVAANAVSCAIIVWWLLHEDEQYRLDLKGIHVVRADLRKLLYIGLPAGLQGMVFSLSNIIVQAAINGFGSSAIAGSAAALNFEFYTYFFVNAFAQAAVTFVGQNYAAGKKERCDAVMKFCMIASVVSAGVTSAICVGFGEMALGLFTTDATAIGFGMVRLWYVELLELLTSSYEVTASGMRGMGWSIIPTVTVIIGSCILRIAYVVFLFPMVYSFENLLAIYPISWVVTGVTMVILFFVARKRAYAAL